MNLERTKYKRMGTLDTYYTKLRKGENILLN